MVSISRECENDCLFWEHQNMSASLERDLQHALQPRVKQTGGFGVPD